MAVDVLRLIIPVGVIWVVAVLVSLYKKVWKKSEELRKKLRKQGITGPPPSFLYGNLPEMKKIQLEAARKAPPNLASHIVAHDYTSTLFPYFEKWRKQYGPLYTYSTGKRQHLYVNKVELVKELNLCNNLDLGKPSYLTHTLSPILGNGIIRSNGLLWSHHRKIIAPQFFMDKVKGRMGLMMNSAKPLLKKWEDRINKAEDKLTAAIRVDEDLRSFSADVISRACFGSSYSKGKQIFSKLRHLQKIISHGGILFGHSSFRFFQPWKQRKIKRLEKEIEALIWETVQGREEECSRMASSEKDLLQLIMEGAVNDIGGCKESSKKFIVDNCKNMYFAGHESTAIAASWCLMLLALHPDWQDRIRNEISQVSPDDLPDAASITQLKSVTMVIHETLRLYPPGAFVSREALSETRIGNLSIPAGVCLWTLIPTLHRDSDIWGEDANEFKPERFENGISKACKYPQAYIPFGAGPRLCVGKNFALVELKIILSLIVSKFRFSLSPNYRHSPSYSMIVVPADGVEIVIRRV